MNLSIIAVVPWREAMQSKFIAAQFIEKLYGPRAAGVVTLLVLWTALASVFALLFGYSRILYAAASDGHFFKMFGHLHARGRFPDVSLLVLGALSILASFGDQDSVISALLTSRILIQFMGQIAALRHLRRHRQDIARPFRMWLYPAPAAIALGGWVYIFVTAGWKYAAFGVLTLGFGAILYVIWSRERKGDVTAG
jgi:amino acid transporter